jgi:hypothetical protein
MDALARKVGAVLHGEDLIDTASVGAMIAAFAIASMPVDIDGRRKAFDKIVDFMRNQVFDPATEFVDGYDDDED